MTTRTPDTTHTLIRWASKLAVCSWSLQPQSPDALIEQLLALGIPRVQLALDPLRENPQLWGKLPSLCAKHHIQIVSGMLATVGEDYSTLESIRRTGGVVPDATWPQNWRHIQDIADLARQLGLQLVTFHAGFLPHDDHDPAFAKLLERIRQIADAFARQNLQLGFETGQETASTLVAFLQKLQRPNVGVNFDPANMILYDQGDPLDALRVLAPWLKQCHLKDAIRTRTPGAWGDEVPLGAGQVNWPEFFTVLHQIQFRGFCAIEREAGQQRLADIQSARQFVESLPPTSD